MQLGYKMWMYTLLLNFNYEFKKIYIYTDPKFSYFVS